MSKLKKITEWIVSVFVVIVFIISALAMIAAINGSKTGVNSLFGKAVFSIQSDSMEDELFEGDLIISDVYDGAELQKGKIITFKQRVGDTIIFNTHRINDVKQIGNTTCYETKGDNEDGIDPGYRLASDIVAVYDDIRIPAVGGFIDWLKTPAGFIICVILPIVAVILYEAYKIISIILKERDARLTAEGPAEISDEVKAEIIRQHMERLKAEAEAEKKSGDDAPPPDGKA